MAYPAAAGQGLYDTSTTQVHELGAVHSFKNSDGTMTLARYVSNGAGATLAAGKVVAWAGGEGEIGGVAATNLAPAQVAGGLAASCADGGFAWVIFRGKQTNLSAGTSTASSSGDRVVAYGAGLAQVAAATYNSTAANKWEVCGLLKAGDALAAGASNTVYWIWK